MKKIVSLALLLLTAMFLLTGCVRFRTTISVSSTGQVDVEMIYAILNEYGGSIMDEEEIAEYEAKGYECEPYAEDGYTGFRLIKKDAGDASGELADSVMDSDVSITKKGSTYVLDIPFDTAGENDNITSLNEYGSYIISGGGFAEIVIVLPTKPVSSNATSVSEDGKTLTWDLLNMGDRSSIHVEYSIGSVIGLWALRIAIGLAILAALAVAAVLIAKAIKKKKAVSPEGDAAIDELRKYKQMLDEGLITPEEYETKKNALLNPPAEPTPTEPAPAEPTEQ